MATKARVVVDDRNWKKFQIRVASLVNKRVKVGVDESAPSNGDFSMADLAFVHEFGSSNGHIPERSYLRSTMRINRSEYRALLDRATDAVIFKGANHEVELRKVGEKVRGDVISRIQKDDLGVPLAQSTIDRKGSSLPLVDTGALVGSIKAVVE